MVFLLLQVMFNASICFENSAHFHPLDPNIPKVIPQSLSKSPYKSPLLWKTPLPLNFSNTRRALPSPLRISSSYKIVDPKNTPRGPATPRRSRTEAPCPWFTPREDSVSGSWPPPNRIFHNLLPTGSFASQARPRGPSSPLSPFRSRAIPGGLSEFRGSLF